MDEKILAILDEIKKELQDIRSILEPKEIRVSFDGLQTNSPQENHD